MRALVTGAGGFVGSYLVQELARRGDDVTALVRPRPGNRIPPSQPRVRTLEADLRLAGEQIAEALRDADAVYHVAASSSGSWRSMFEANVVATERLVAAMREVGWRGRLVHVSSFSVYGFNQLPSGATVDETAPLEPAPGRRDDYAWTKALQERLIRQLQAEAGGPEVVIVRPGTIYGRERQFQHRIGRQIGGRGVLMIGGRNLMPLNYVENTASLLAECGHHPAAVGEIFNAVDRDPLTQWQYLRRWTAAQPHPVMIVPVPATVFRVAGSAYLQAEQLTHGAVSPPLPLQPYAASPTLRPFAYAPSRAEAVLGWRAPVSRDQALERTFGPKR